MSEYSPAQWRTMLKLDELEDRENLPRGTLTAVMRAESNGKSTVVSPAGAGGLFQLMPGTAASYKADRFDPQQSADAAAKELGTHYKRYGGDLQQTLAAWNWGNGNLQKHGLANAPAETKGFIPRVLKWLTPGSAEASERPAASGRTALGAPAGGKWYDAMPEKPPSAAAPPEQPPARTALPPTDTAPASKWYDAMPDTPPASPPAATPGAPAQVPLPGELPTASVAPVPQQDAAVPMPAPDARVPLGESPTESGFLLDDVANRPGYQEQPQVPLSHAFKEAGKEAAATTIETGLGIAGGMGGAAVAGPAGAVGGGILGQSTGRRITNALGLREQEDYLAKVGPLNIYPSDALNVGLGLLVGLPSIAKNALKKSYFGRAVTKAEEATVAAHGEWQTLHDAALKAQAEGQKDAYAEGMLKARIARSKYEDAANARNKLIQSNETEYKTLMHNAEQEAATARLADKGAAEKALAEQQRKAQAVVDEFQGKAQAREADIAAAPEKQATKWEVEQAQAQRKQNQWRQKYLSRQAQRQQAGREAIQEGEAQFAEGVEAVGVAERSQQQTITKAKQLPGIKRQADPSWTLYDDWRAEAKSVDLPLESYKSKLADVRATRVDSISGEPTPFPTEVERIAVDLEKAGATGNMQSVHEQIKKLGKLSQSPNGDVRRSAGQVAEILMDAMEEAPTALASLRKANAAWRRELVTKQMNDMVDNATSHKQGKLVINVDAVLDKFRAAMKKPLFAKSLTAEETQTFYDNLKLLAEKNPSIPNMPEPPRPELLPGGAPQTPKIPERPEIRGLSAPMKVPEPLTPSAQVQEAQRVTQGLADAPSVKPTRVEFPAAPKPEPPVDLPGSVKVPEVPYKGPAYTKEPGDLPPEAVQPTIGERPKVWPGVAKLGTYGAMAYTFTRLGVSTPLIDKALIAAAVGGGSVVVGKQMNWLLSKAMLNSRYAPALQAAMAADGTIHPAFFPLMRAALTPAERQELDRDTRSPQKARR